MGRLSSLILGISLLLLPGTQFTGEAGAADRYPVKPRQFHRSPGGRLGRGHPGPALCRKVSAAIGQPVMIVNKPGGGSADGVREVYASKPDGYTIGMAPITLVTNKLQGILPYDHHDFTPLGTFYMFNHVIIASNKTSRPFKTIQEVIDFARKNPGEVKLATAGVGQSLWIAAHAFIDGTGISVNAIPQTGAGGSTVLQAAGGHVDIAVVGVGTTKSQLEAGNVRLIAVIGTKQPPYDDVSTLKEVGYDIDWETFGILIGPPKMSKEATDDLAKAVEEAATDPEYADFLTGVSAYPFYLPPDKVRQVPGRAAGDRPENHGQDRHPEEELTGRAAGCKASFAGQAYLTGVPRPCRISRMWSM